MGAPSKYPADAPARLRDLAEAHRDGLTDEEVAAYFGVQDRTVRNWGKKYPEFLQALIEARAVVDREVERSLYRRAVGYRVPDKKVIKDGEGNIIRTETTTKEVLPDVTAQIFWLKNRKPRVWRDKQDIEHSGTTRVVIVDDIRPNSESTE